MDAFYASQKDTCVKNIMFTELNDVLNVDIKIINFIKSGRLNSRWLYTFCEHNDPADK